MPREENRGELLLREEMGSDDSDIEILEEDGSNLMRNDNFVIDTSGQNDEEMDAEGNQEHSSFNFSGVVSHLVEDTNGENKSKSRGRRSNHNQACFNCDSLDHAIRDCPHPRDQRRISLKRESFTMKRREGSGRFHEESNVKDEIAPGKISDSLREALGIGERELPEWIYRMREKGLLEGYPPAYRNRAAEEAVFDFHEGEEGTSRKRKHKELDGRNLTIDSNKIIKYPGFNFDDKKSIERKGERRWRIPPFQEFVEAQQVYLKQKHALESSQRALHAGSPSAKKPKTENNPNRKTFDDEDSDDTDILIISEKTSSSLEDGEIPDGEVLRVDASNVTVRKTKRSVKKAKRSMPSTSAETAAASSSQADQKVKNQTILETVLPEEKHIATDKHNHEVTKPSIESFAQDILPFQHQQPLAKPLGFIKKLHTIIRSIRPSGGEGST